MYADETPGVAAVETPGVIAPQTPAGVKLWALGPGVGAYAGVCPMLNPGVAAVAAGVGALY